MRALLFALPLLAFAASCGGDALPPGPDLAIRVEAPEAAVRPGAGFPLSVVRAWGDHLDPAPWDDRTLSPLVLKPEGVFRREGSGRVEETRRFRAYAFSREDVEVRAPKIAAKAKDGGPDRTAVAPSFRVRVRPEVDAAAPGAPELPGEAPPEPSPWRQRTVLGLAALALLLLAALVVRARRRRLAPTLSPVSSGASYPPAPPPSEVALGRLGEIRARAGRDALADVVAVSAVVRDYVAARFAVPARERTSEEILLGLQGAAGLEASPTAALSRVLARCDAVKFAAGATTEAGFAALVDDAETFVRETAP